MPTTTPEHDERIAKMTFSSVYPHYVTKVEKKGRTKEELHQVITWLTGFDDKQLQKYIDSAATFKEFPPIELWHSGPDLLPVKIRWDLVESEYHLVEYEAD